jgi:hypothetical protein
MDGRAEAPGRPEDPTRPGAGWVEAVIWLASLVADRDGRSPREDAD